MAKYYRGHSKGGRFDQKSTGDLGLRAYKDQQQNIIDNLKLSQKQASDVNRDYLIADSNKTAKEEKNREEINRLEDKIYQKRRGAVEIRGKREVDRLRGEAKEFEKKAEFWKDFSTTYSKQWGELAQGAYEFSDRLYADRRQEQQDKFDLSGAIDARAKVTQEWVETKKAVFDGHKTDNIKNFSQAIDFLEYLKEKDPTRIEEYDAAILDAVEKQNTLLKLGGRFGSDEWSTDVLADFTKNWPNFIQDTKNTVLEQGGEWNKDTIEGHLMLTARLFLGHNHGVNNKTRRKIMKKVSSYADKEIQKVRTDEIVVEKQKTNIKLVKNLVNMHSDASTLYSIDHTEDVESSQKAKKEQEAKIENAKTNLVNSVVSEYSLSSDTQTSIKIKLEGRALHAELIRKMEPEWKWSYRELFDFIGTAPAAGGNEKKGKPIKSFNEQFKKDEKLFEEGQKIFNANRTKQAKQEKIANANLDTTNRDLIKKSINRRNGTLTIPGTNVEIDLTSAEAPFKLRQLSEKNYAGQPKTQGFISLLATLGTYHGNEANANKPILNDLLVRELKTNEKADLSYFATFLAGLPDGHRLKEDLQPLYNDLKSLQDHDLIKTINEASEVTLHKGTIPNLVGGRHYHDTQQSAKKMFKQIVLTHFGNSRGDKNKSIDQRVNEAIAYARELWEQGAPITGTSGENIPGKGIFRREIIGKEKGIYPMGTTIYKVWEKGEPPVPEKIDEVPGHIIGFGLGGVFRNEGTMKGSITEDQIKVLIDDSNKSGRPLVSKDFRDEFLQKFYKNESFSLEHPVVEYLYKNLEPGSKLTREGLYSKILETDEIKPGNLSYAENIIKTLSTNSEKQSTESGNQSTEPKSEAIFLPKDFSLYPPYEKIKISAALSVGGGSFPTSKNLTAMIDTLNYSDDGSVDWKTVDLDSIPEVYNGKVVDFGNPYTSPHRRIA